MQVSEFEEAPTKARHPAYETSMLYTTAPEWSTGEVLLAAACRGLVLGVSESTVDLANIGGVPRLMPAAAGGTGTWTRLLTAKGGIASPLRHGQHSPMAARQLMPLVPQIARIAGVLGKRPRSRWNPANLLKETVGSGLGQAGGAAVLRALGEALVVSAADDVFARFVENSLREGLQGLQPAPAAEPPFAALTLDDELTRAFRRNSSPGGLSPAERFSRDLAAAIAIKAGLTRRQWTVLLESMLRLGLGMHVLWTCNANIVAWEAALLVASGNASPAARDVELAAWEARADSGPLLELGANAEPLIKRKIEKYAFARTGLNLLLCLLEEAGCGWQAGTPIGCSTGSDDAPAALALFLAHVQASRHLLDPADAGKALRDRVGQLFDQREDLRALANCESGYTKNLFEFIRHSLGQVKAKDPDQRCYDLAYLLAYSGDQKPLPVQPGPAMLVMLVQACCATNPAIPVSLDDFRRHLGDYGLHAPAGELVHGKTGRDMAILGLVVDSPDAAGGRLLVKPF